MTGLAERIDERERVLRDWAASAKPQPHDISPDGFVSTAGAAGMFFRSAKTLERWQTEGTLPDGIVWRRNRGAIEYSVRTIATYLVSIEATPLESPQSPSFATGTRCGSG